MTHQRPPLHYEERGEGAPVVLVHGSASDGRTFASQVTTFGTRFRAIALSRRYHHPNDPIAPGQDYSMAEHIEDLERFIRASSREPVHLVGHSYGALVCLLLACRHPSLVRSLVLEEPPALRLFTSDPPRPLELLGVLLSRPRTAFGIIKLGATGLGPATAAAKRGDSERALECLGRAILGDKAFRQQSDERLQQAQDNFIAAELLGSGMSPMADEELRELRCPVLLVVGARSPTVFHRFADRLEELLPNVERVCIPDASHITHEDNPAAFDEAVMGFLEIATPAA